MPLSGGPALATSTAEATGNGDECEIGPEGECDGGSSQLTSRVCMYVYMYIHMCAIHRKVRSLACARAHIHTSHIRARIIPADWTNIWSNDVERSRSFLDRRRRGDNRGRETRMITLGRRGGLIALFDLWAEREREREKEKERENERTAAVATAVTII